MFLEGRQILKPNYTSEFESSPSDSGEPEEHARTGTGRLNKGKKGKSVQVMQRIRAKNANSDLLLPPGWEGARGSYYCCSASSGEEQEPCQNCCSDASSGCRKVKATVLLPRQQGHNPPAQQHPLPGSWEAWNLPRASLQTSSQDGKGTGTKPRRRWTQRLDYNASRTHTESQGLHEGHPRPQGKGNSRGEERPVRRGSLAQQPLQQRRIPSFIIQAEALSHTFTRSLLRSH